MNCHTDLSIHHFAYKLTITMPQVQVDHFNLVNLHAVFIQRIIMYTTNSIIKSWLKTVQWLVIDYSTRRQANKTYN